MVAPSSMAALGGLSTKISLLVGLNAVNLRWFKVCGDPVSSLPAIPSMNCRSNTFKTQRNSIIADLAADTPSNGDHAASRHLGCPTDIVVLLKPGLRDLHPEALKASGWVASPFGRTGSCIWKDFGLTRHSEPRSGEGGVGGHGSPRFPGLFICRTSGTP
ncbi:MAG: hypothetical protein ABSF90_21980 [Syntrophobacteraceae bacterium]